MSFNLVQFEYKTNHGSSVELTFDMFIQCIDNRSKGMFLGGGFYTCQNTKPSKFNAPPLYFSNFLNYVLSTCAIDLSTFNFL